MTINIAIAGAGFIANIHAMAIRNQEDANLVAVVEKFPDKSSAFSRKYGIKRQHATIEKMLKVGGVDALIVGSPMLYILHKASLHSRPE